MLSHRTPIRTATSAATSRAWTVRVSAVARPTGKQRAAQQQAAKPSSGDKESADAGAKRKRSSQYTSWQSMAQHASNPSATPSGFDESMM